MYIWFFYRDKSEMHDSIFYCKTDYTISGIVIRRKCPILFVIVNRKCPIIVIVIDLHRKSEVLS
jgi:hypothetical protein